MNKYTVILYDGNVDQLLWVEAETVESAAQKAIEKAYVDKSNDDERSADEFFSDCSIDWILEGHLLNLM